MSTVADPEFITVRNSCHRLFSQAAEQPLTIQSWTYWNDEVLSFLTAVNNRDTAEIRNIINRLKLHTWQIEVPVPV